MRQGSYTEIDGDATRPAHEGECPIVIPHVVNDIGRWGSGFVLALNDRFGLGPREAYLAWAAGKSWEEQSEAALAHSAGDAGPVRPGGVPLGLGETQLVDLPNLVTVANMCAQHRVRGMEEDDLPPIRYAALVGCMEQVQEYCLEGADEDGGGATEIHCPRFGSDLAGGDWKVISQLCREIWCSVGINVTVYVWKP